MRTHSELLTSTQNPITALHLACDKHDIKEVSRLLLDQQSNINAVDPHGNTPLHRVLLYQPLTNTQVLIAQLLTACGAEFKIANNKGITVQSLVAQQNEICQRLLKDSTKVKAIDADGNTALHRVLLKPSLSKTDVLIAQFLIARGARLVTKNKQEISAQDLVNKQKGKQSDALEYSILKAKITLAITKLVPKKVHNVNQTKTKKISSIEEQRAQTEFEKILGDVFKDLKEYATTLNSRKQKLVEQLIQDLKNGVQVYRACKNPAQKEHFLKAFEFRCAETIKLMDKPYFKIFIETVLHKIKRFLGMDVSMRCTFTHTGVANSKLNPGCFFRSANEAFSTAGSESESGNLKQTKIACS